MITWDATAIRLSENLKNRHSRPMYVWWLEVSGTVVDPYRLLPPVFSDGPCEVVDVLESDSDLQVAQGGAATAAYGRLQLEELVPQDYRLIEAPLQDYWGGGHDGNGDGIRGFEPWNHRNGSCPAKQPWPELPKVESATLSTLRGTMLLMLVIRHSNISTGIN